MLLQLLGVFAPVFVQKKKRNPTEQSLEEQKGCLKAKIGKAAGQLGSGRKGGRLTHLRNRN
jgi:hypothetical protein